MYIVWLEYIDSGASQIDATLLIYFFSPLLFMFSCKNLQKLVLFMPIQNICWDSSSSPICLLSFFQSSRWFVAFLWANWHLLGCDCANNLNMKFFLIMFFMYQCWVWLHSGEYYNWSCVYRSDFRTFC